MAKETKKDPQDLSVEEKLRALYQLQTMLSEIDKIKTLRGELPLEVQDLEDEVTGLGTRIDKINREIADLKQDVAQKKNEIDAARSSVEKYKTQLDNVRNNREYDMLNKEIEFQNLEIELCEKRIREYTAAAAAKAEEIERSSAQLEERKKDLDVKKSELNEIVAETEKDEKALMDKSERYQKHIEPRWLRLYERIRNNAHNGLAVVCVERDACGGCFSKIPPQRQIDIRMHKKIISCEYCGRFLVDDSIKEKAEEIVKNDN